MTARPEPNHLVMLNLGLMKIRLVSASGMLFSAFGRHIFHPRPQDGVFRCAFNKIGGGKVVVNVLYSKKDRLSILLS